jgi:hypothetical protein
MTKSRRDTKGRRRADNAARLQQAAVAGALALSAVTAFGSAARAQDANSEPTTIWNWDQKLGDKVLQTLGLKDGPGIDYRERSPLVVPPSLDLPPPKQKSAKAQVPANWPADPAAAKADKPAAKATKAYANDDAAWLDFTGSQVGSIRKSASANAPAPGGNGKMDDPDTAEKPLRPSDLNTKGTNFFTSFFKKSDDTEFGTFTGEQPRTSLIEPPQGYQTPSPNQPYGVTKRSDFIKPQKSDPAGGDAMSR